MAQRVLVESLYKKGQTLFNISSANEDNSELFKNFEHEVMPYTSITEIFTFLELFVNNELPKWLSLTSPIKPGTSYCYRQSDMLSEPRQCLLRRSEPKTLLCHDYKGGYLLDRFVNYNWEDASQYNFTQWSLIDTFVYFSHNLVTVPPPCWINAGHAHSVRVLGTLITEGKSGAEFWQQILETEEKWLWLADALSVINQVHQFDGYLLNVENVLLHEHVPKLVEFVRYLRNILPKTSLLIWYDSVVETGDLKWQNALNLKNLEFFNACDGIFLNYNYQDWQLIKSAEMAAGRRHDVYVGIDVFGRGCPGSGFFSSDAAAMARRHDLSIAVFAPGWTEEVAASDPVLNNKIFWSALGKYLYVHGPSGDLAVPHHILGGKRKGDVNFNELTGASTDELFLWEGPSGAVLLSLMPPTPDTTKQFRALLDIQDAVVTYKKKDITQYYSAFPIPLLDVNETSDLYINKTLAIDTRDQKSNRKIALMIFETELKSGVQINIRSFGSGSRPGRLVGYTTIDEDGQIVDIMFDIQLLPNAWAFQSANTSSTGKLLEVGFIAYPETTAYVSDVVVRQL